MQGVCAGTTACPKLVVADRKAALESPSTHARTAARKAALEEKKLRLEELKIRRDTLDALSPKSNGDPLYDLSIFELPKVETALQIIRRAKNTDSAASLSDRIEPLISDVQKEEMMKNSSKKVISSPKLGVGSVLSTSEKVHRFQKNCASIPEKVHLFLVAQQRKLAD